MGSSRSPAARAGSRARAGPAARPLPAPVPGRWLPGPLRDPAQRRQLLGWLGVGLAVRLLLMPFTVSGDLLAVYWRSHLIAYEGEVFGSYLVNMGAHYTHAAALRLLGPLLPDAQQLWTSPWWWDDNGLAPQLIREFASAPDAFQTLFALKLPYLAFDLAAGLVILALVARARPMAVRRAWIFWMLSPIGLYATYVFGRYEAFAVLFVVVALLAAERERPWLAALSLGVGVTMRTYPLMAIPVLALVTQRGLPRQGASGALALVPLALTMAANRLLGGGAGEFASLSDTPPGDMFLAFTLPVSGPGEVYLLVVALLGVYGYLLGRSAGWWGPGPPAVGDLWLWLLVVHAAVFAFSAFSAHYFMWFTPFVALALARREHWRHMLPVHLLQVLVVLALHDLVNAPRVGLGAFQPLAPSLVQQLPNLRELVLPATELRDLLLGLGRSAFLVLTALIVWPALGEATRRRRQAPDGERARAGQQQQPAEGEPGRPAQPAQPLAGDVGHE